MSKGKIVFLAANASYSHTNLAGWYLGKYAETAGWQWHEVEILKSDFFSQALQRVLDSKPDILATSFYLFNRQFLLSFIKRFKALRTDCPVIAGGPEFLGDNFNFLDQHREISAVIRGEGEKAFAAWLERWDKPEKWAGIKGLCAFVGGKYIDNGRAEIIINLDEIPSPYENNLVHKEINPSSRLSFRASRGISVDNIDTAEILHPSSPGSPVAPPATLGVALRAGCHREEWRPWLPSSPRLRRTSRRVPQRCPAACRGVLHFVQDDKSPRSARFNPNNFPKPFLLLETSRGCSNQCAFCTSACERVRFFSLERVRKDLSIIAAAGVGEIRLTDRTFNENPKRCLELLRIMRVEFPGVRFHLEIDPARLSGEMLQEISLADPGTLHLEVGIQTLRENTLKALGRFGSPGQSLKMLAELCRMRNLAVHVDLIAGLPEAKLTDLYHDLSELVKMGPDEIQLELLKILPGTRLSADRGKWDIISAPEPPYEVLQTAAMSVADLMKAKKLSNIVDWFYNAPELKQPLAAANAQISHFFGKFLDFCGDFAGSENASALENRFRTFEKFLRRHKPDLLPKLGYEWLKWGLSAQHGIFPASPWKENIPAEAVLIEGDEESARQKCRVYLAELDTKYLFVYGQNARRRACAIYAFPKIIRPAVSLPH